LEAPDKLADEYRRRLHETSNSMVKSDELAQLGQQTAALQRGIGRLIDSYAAGVIDRSEFEPRLAGLRSRVAQRQEQRRVAGEAAETKRELTLIMGQFEDFAATLRHSLDDLDWLSTGAVIRALVRRVEIDHDHIKVVFHVPPPTNSSGPEHPGQAEGKPAVRHDCTAGR
jgi:site-specific DNA recombinase